MVTTVLNLGLVIPLLLTEFYHIRGGLKYALFILIVFNVSQGTVLSHKFLDLVSSFTSMWLRFIYIVMGILQVLFTTTP